MAAVMMWRKAQLRWVAAALIPFMCAVALRAAELFRISPENPLLAIAPATGVRLERIEKSDVVDRIRLRVRSTPEGEAPVGWIVWDATITDAFGKSITAKGGGPRIVDIAGVLNEQGPWSISLRGVEYIAGERRRLNEVVAPGALPVPPRAAAHGVTSLHLLPAGTYRIRGQEITRIEPTKPEQDELRADAAGVIEVQTTTLAVLLGTSATAPTVKLSARLRERPEGDKGSAFMPRRTTVADVGSTRFQLHRFGREDETSITTNSVEIEVVAALPPVNFVVPPSAGLSGLQL